MKNAISGTDMGAGAPEGKGNEFYVFASFPVPRNAPKVGGGAKAYFVDVEKDPETGWINGPHPDSVAGDYRENFEKKNGGYGTLVDGVSVAVILPPREGSKPRIYPFKREEGKPCAVPMFEGEIPEDDAEIVAKVLEADDRVWEREVLEKEDTKRYLEAFPIIR